MEYNQIRAIYLFLIYSKIYYLILISIFNFNLYLFNNSQI